MTWHVRFITSFVLTLAIGIITTESLNSPSGAGPLLIVLLIALVAQSQVFANQHMNQDRLVSPDFQIRRGFFLRGFFVETFVPEEKETTFLKNVLANINKFKIRAFYAVILIALLWFHSARNFQVSATTILQAGAVMLIVPIATPSQFLVPITLNAICVLIAFSRQAPPPIFLLPLYGLALFTTLSLHYFQNLQWTDLGKEGNQPPKSGRVLRQAFAHAAIFFVLLAATNWILPNASPLEKDPAFQQLQNLNEKFIHMTSESAGTIAKKYSGGRGGTDSGSGRGSSTSGNSSGSGAAGASSMAGAASGEGRRESTENQKVPDELLGQIKTMQDKLAKDRKTLEKTPQGEERHELEKKVQDLKEEIERAQNGAREFARNPEPQGAHHGTGQMPDLNPQGPQRNGQPFNQQQAGSTGAPTSGQGQAEANVGGTDGISQGGGTGSEFGRSSSAKSGGSHEPAPKSLNFETPPRQLLNEEMLKKLYELMKLILILAAGIFVINFVLKLFKKPAKAEENKKIQVAQNSRKKLREEFARIREERLTPREEIMKKYQIFLKFMETLSQGKAPFTPPTHYYYYLRNVFPSLDGDFDEINSTFCHTLYGERPVGSEHVTRFDGALQKIFHTFR